MSFTLPRFSSFSVHAFMNTLVLSWGWQRLGWAFLAGALTTLAQAPLHLFPILTVSFAMLIWLLDGASSVGESRWRRLRPALAIGWWFGFGAHLTGLYWVGSAFLVEADKFGWMMPFAVVLLPAGLALFTAVAAAVARSFWSLGWTRVLSLALALCLMEWLRGVVLTGFPWNTYGYALAANTALMQIASVVGVWGMTFFAILILASPTTLLDDEPRPNARFGLPIFGLALLVAIIAFGMVRLSLAKPEYADGITLRVMQPSIPQNEKWRPENRTAIFNKYISLSDKATRDREKGLYGISLLVWPESAFPFLLQTEPGALSAIANLIPEGTTLVTGAARAEDDGKGGSKKIYNSVLAIDALGEIVGVYDKKHLVPFGEYLPLQSWLETIGLEQLTRLKGGFAAGTQRRTLTIADLPPFSPLICYEVIFPHAVVDQKNRPGFLLNVTNDAWFGDSLGPRQHAHQARVRAVEEGLPLVRAANNGISMVVDAYGRLEAHLPMNYEGVIDSRLPAHLSPTLYAQYGDYPFLLLLVISSAILIVTRLRNKH